MAAPDSSDFVWSASNLARVSRASSRSRSRSVANHSSNGASVTPRPSSRSPRYRSTACGRASGSALRASRWNARTSTSSAPVSSVTVSSSRRRLGETTDRSDRRTNKTFRRLARVARKIGQQRLGFLELDRHGVTGSSLEVEATEQTQLQSRHLAENTSLLSARDPLGTPTGTCGTTPPETTATCTCRMRANRSWSEGSNNQDSTNPVEKEHDRTLNL